MLTTKAANVLPKGNPIAVTNKQLGTILVFASAGLFFAGLVMLSLKD